MGYGGYIFGSGMVANVYSNLDQIMIARFMKSPAFVSYYSIAARISALIDIPSYAAADIIFPKASKAHVEEGREKVTYLFERMVAILLAFTVPTTFFIILFSKLVILIIAGSGYEAAAPILQLYMVASIFRPVQNQAANLLNSIGKAKLVFIVNTVTLITLLAINYFCLLHFEFYGAAIGALITAMTGFIIWYFLMRKQVDLNMKRVFNHTIDTYKLIYHQVMSMLGKNKKQAAE
jgi:O-antigen/teichoic acid export membrane protein